MAGFIPAIHVFSGPLMKVIRRGCPGHWVEDALRAL